MNITTIDISERDLEIRVTHDLEGALGSVVICRDGVEINGECVPWKKPALVPEMWDAITLATLPQGL